MPMCVKEKFMKTKLDDPHSCIPNCLRVLAIMILFEDLQVFSSLGSFSDSVGDIEDNTGMLWSPLHAFLCLTSR